MELWLITLVSISIVALLKTLTDHFTSKKTAHSLPPGPFSIPLISDILWLFKPFSQLEPILRSLHAKLGPVVKLPIGFQSVMFVADRFLAHQALVKNGAVFAGRAPASAIGKFITQINSTPYGPTWRLLRRNINAEILNPSRVKCYSQARKWVLRVLIDRLVSKSESNKLVRVVEDFAYAMFCLLVLMCFGDKVNEDQIKKLDESSRKLFSQYPRFIVLNFWPSMTKFFLRKQWEEFFKFRQEEDEVYLPLIWERKKSIEENIREKDNYVLAYVDTLFDLELPDKKRKVNESEIVNLCAEFLTAGTDTTSTALQWIIANLVKYPQIQEKLYTEMKTVVGDEVDEIEEEDIHKIPYLKAVILEGLRRHPPAHSVLPHAVTENTVVDKYLFPKGSLVNFMVAEMGWDPKVWEDPMEFKPERFLETAKSFDITGSKEIKMMPFGAGRRMCPAYGLAMLHLEYFVANMIWKFEWKAKDGDDVDLSETELLAFVMKYPLEASIRLRSRS